MKRRSLPALAAGTAAVLAVGIAAANAVPIGFGEDRSAELAKQIDPSKPKNVILIIGDGMDDSMITAARNYDLGANGRFAGLDNLAFTGAMTTHGLKAGTAPDYPIAYVSDSAPTASGWSTGKKTIDSRISQGPSEALNIAGEDYKTVLEYFKEAGKPVGNVSTAALTDATPGAAGAHINARACQGPRNMDATGANNCTPTKKSEGGKGSIAEQLVDNEIDVLIGGGYDRFAQATDAGPSVIDYATATYGYDLVRTAGELDAVTSLDDGPVLGLFAPENMTPMYQPLLASAAGSGGSDTTCQASDRGTQPDLSSMTKKAIELLDNEDGFFLQTESAMIDKQEHAIDICGAIGDLVELNETVEVALEYQAENPDTLIIVTGDHAHSTQIVGGAGQGTQTATVRTADGDPMTVAYSTGVGGSNHTGAQIRVAASGPQAANVTGVIDQTDLFNTMMGRTPSTLPTEPAPTVTVTATPTQSPTPTPTPQPTSTPAPQPSSKPAVQVAAPKTVARGERAWIAVAAGDADTVKVVVIQGKNRITTTLKAAGGTFRLPALRAGSARVKVIAKGEGGTTKVKEAIRIR